MDQLDQGTILWGVRSDKYPGIPCYGIIITASCDIANDKVSKIYYLVGVKAQDWFCTDHSYHVVYREKMKTVFDKFYDKCRKLSLDAQTLQVFSKDEVEKVIEAEVQKARDQKALKQCYDDFSVFCRPGMDNKARKEAIQHDNTPAINFLSGIEQGKIFHYHYLPEACYLEKSETMNSGLIIDLQEISSISLGDAKKILSPGIDGLILNQEEECEQLRLKSLFWLETENDFVAVEGKINSPWREHLMQRFSHDFSRIGLDGAKKEDYQKLVESI